MKADLYLRNATVISENGRFHGGVVAAGGLISELVHGNPDIAAAETVDLAGKILLPGIIDAHTHFSEPGRDFEGYRSGSMAAAAGGVTTILDMPLNDLPPTTNRATLAKKRAMVEGQSTIDYGHWGALIDNNLAHLQEQHAEGVIAFKAFMRTVADFPRVDDGLLYAGLQTIAECGNVLGVHAENEYVTSYLREKLRAEGRKDRRAWNESRPPEQELEAIQRAIFWAKAAGARLHICHISLASAVQSVRQAVQDGFKITGETCSHYLFFKDEDYYDIGPTLRAAPPIRSADEVDALWGCVLRGEVDAITSDHSPFPPERYQQGMNNVWEGGGGVMGLQSMLPAVITEGVHRRGMSWELIARLMSSNPARIFGIYPQKGALLPQSEADFTVVDPDREWVLKAEDLFYRYKQSPYVGRSFKGAVTHTIVRGRIVFSNSRIAGEPGYGRLVRRMT
jgi:allantoinase